MNPKPFFLPFPLWNFGTCPNQLELRGVGVSVCGRRQERFEVGWKTNSVFPQSRALQFNTTCRHESRWDNYNPSAIQTHSLTVLDWGLSLLVFWNSWLHWESVCGCVWVFFSVRHIRSDSSVMFLSVEGLWSGLWDIIDQWTVELWFVSVLICALFVFCLSGLNSMIYSWHATIMTCHCLRWAPPPHSGALSCQLTSRGQRGSLTSPKRLQYTTLHHAGLWSRSHIIKT